MRTIATKPDGVDLKDYPELRSDYQKLWVNKTSKHSLIGLLQDPRANESLAEMEKDKAMVNTILILELMTTSD